jgi:hypothetical protein
MAGTQSAVSVQAWRSYGIALTLASVRSRENHYVVIVTFAAGTSSLPPDAWPRAAVSDRDPLDRRDEGEPDDARRENRLDHSHLDWTKRCSRVSAVALH